MRVGTVVEATTGISIRGFAKFGPRQKGTVALYDEKYWNGHTVPVRFEDGTTRTMRVRSLRVLHEVKPELTVVPAASTAPQLAGPARSPERRKAAPRKNKQAGAA